MLKKRTKNILYVLAGILIFAILYALKNTTYFLRALGFVFFIFLFFIIDYLFNLGFKKHHYLIVILLSTAGVLLSPLYFISPNYDKILHFISPFLIAILIFFLVDKLKTEFSIKLVITLAIVISLLAIFEIGEYLLDQLFDLKLQGVYLRDYTGIAKLNIIQDRNDDTMIDLILGTIGSLLFVLWKTAVFHYNKIRISLK